MANPAVAQYEWHADWGLDLSRPFVWKDPSGTAVTVTGYTAVLTVRRAYSTEIVLTAANGSGITVGTTDGKFTVLVDGSEMDFGSPYVETEYVFDLVVTSAGGLETKLVEGTMIVHPTASR